MSTEPDLAHRDFQFGEWLRADIIDGKSLRPAQDPDVVLLVASALSRHVVLRGPALADVLPLVPFAHARDAALRVIPSVIRNAAGDERNALLTLARILVTAHTGTIVSKDAASARIIPSLAEPDRGLMERAMSGYLHGNDGDWSGETSQVSEVLKRLARLARSAPFD
jgi:hypothetical protein